MPLYKRHSTWWLDYTDEHGARQRKSTRCRDRNAAAMVAGEVLRSVEMRRAGCAVGDPVACRRPIGEVISDYLATLDGRGMHRENVDKRLRRAARDAGWDTIGDITPESVRRHLDALSWHGEPVKAKTRNQVRQALHSLCGWAMRQRPPMLALNPVAMVPVVAESDDPMRWPLSEDEFEALLDAPPPPQTQSLAGWPGRRLAYLLAGEAGLRRGDAKHLVAGRVRLAGLNPFVELPGATTKGRRFEQVPLTDRLARELAEWTRGMGAGEPVLAAVPKVRVLRADCRRAGIATENPTGLDLDYHTLRHTFVHRLFRAGVSVHEVQRLARHRDPMTTLKVYAQIGGGSAADAVRRLGAVTVGVTAPVPPGARSVPRWAQLGEEGGAVRTGG